MLTHPLRYSPARRRGSDIRAAGLLLAVGMLAGTAGIAAPATSPLAPLHQAYDPVTGKTVTVSQPMDATPVHPEAITHPQQDGMVTTAAGFASPTQQPGQALELAMATPAHPPGLRGIDVSSYQGVFRWASVAPRVSFVYVKATEGTYYRNPDFVAQYRGAIHAHRIRGAYHFAIPNNSRGSVQANFFVRHGGGWRPGGRTLPGALDIEPNPYGRACYGLSKSQMTRWIWGFVRQYAFDTGVWPVIYTTSRWWRACTLSDRRFSRYDPLWIACYCSHAGPLPRGYGFYTFWQYSDFGSWPGDQDVFNGPPARLTALARG